MNIVCGNDQNGAVSSHGERGTQRPDAEMHAHLAEDVAALSGHWAVLLALCVGGIAAAIVGAPAMVDYAASKASAKVRVTCKDAIVCQLLVVSGAAAHDEVAPRHRRHRDGRVRVRRESGEDPRAFRGWTERRCGTRFVFFFFVPFMSRLSFVSRAHNRGKILSFCVLREEEEEEEEDQDDQKDDDDTGRKRSSPASLSFFVFFFFFDRLRRRRFEEEM